MLMKTKLEKLEKRIKPKQRLFIIHGGENETIYSAGREWTRAEYEAETAAITARGEKVLTVIWEPVKKPGHNSLSCSRGDSKGRSGHG